MSPGLRGWAVTACFVAAAAPLLGSSSGRSEASTSFLALAIENIGPQDRTIPPLVIHASGEQARVAGLAGAPVGAEWAEIPAESFEMLAARLDAEFFRAGRDDPNASARAGSHRFTLLGEETPRGLRLDPDRSAALMRRALELLPSGSARSEVARRLSMILLE